MLLANWRPVRLVLLGFFCVPFYLSGTWRALMHVVGPLMPVIRDQIFCALCRPFAMLPVMSSVFWAYLEWGLHKICPNYGVLWSFWLRISFPAVLLWVFYLFVFGFFLGGFLFIYLFISIIWRYSTVSFKLNQPECKRSQTWQQSEAEQNHLEICNWCLLLPSTWTGVGLCMLFRGRWGEQRGPIPLRKGTCPLLTLPGALHQKIFLFGGENCFPSHHCFPFYPRNPNLHGF